MNIIEQQSWRPRAYSEDDGILLTTCRTSAYCIAATFVGDPQEVGQRGDGAACCVALRARARARRYDTQASRAYDDVTQPNIVNGGRETTFPSVSRPGWRCGRAAWRTAHARFAACAAHTTTTARARALRARTHAPWRRDTPHAFARRPGYLTVVVCYVIAAYRRDGRRRMVVIIFVSSSLHTTHHYHVPFRLPAYAVEYRW